jgi:hypothetical protein
MSIKDGYGEVGPHCHRYIIHMHAYWMIFNHTTTLNDDNASLPECTFTIT